MGAVRKLSITLPIDRWDPERGGAERYLDHVCLDLCQRGHEITVLCVEAIERGGAFPPGLSIERLDVPRFPRWRRELTFARRSVRAHRESGRDLLFAVRHALEADVYQPHGGCFRAARRGASGHLPLALRAANQVVAGCRPATQILLWLDREVFRRSPEITLVSISGKVEDEFKAMYPEVAYHFRRLYHGVDTRHFQDGDREALASGLRVRHEIPRTHRVAVFLAHRFRPKGLRHVLQALSRVKQWHVLVGGRDDPRSFRRLAARLGMDRRVHFLGAVSDSREVLAGADALVLPTYFDACSLAVLEALACGTPVVTTLQSGSGELMESGQHGFVLERPDQERELAEALNVIDANWDAFHEAALGLREKIGWERHIDGLEEILFDTSERVRERAR